MKKSTKLVGKGEEKLVKEDALMLSIDDMAERDRKVTLVGGDAYVSSYDDKMTVSQVMDIKSEGKKQQSEEMSKGAAVGIIVTLLLLVIISLIVIFLFVK